MFECEAKADWPVACSLLTSRATAREEELAMARQGKPLPARRTRPAMDDSLLIRSAESLGRMIGTLQRQLDGASKRLHHNGTDVMGVFGVDGQQDGQRGAMKTAAKRKGTKATAAKTTRANAAGKAGSKSGATKVRSTADRTSKRASKSAVGKKSAGRGRTGTTARKSTKGSRSR